MDTIRRRLQKISIAIMHIKSTRVIVKSRTHRSHRVTPTLYRPSYSRVVLSDSEHLFLIIDILIWVILGQPRTIIYAEVVVLLPILNSVTKTDYLIDAHANVTLY